ncbi:hypothetical protein HDU86_007530 [Geranomyces michiganensis]|nr:hypothetical protein HDU86_007530 [Geranomyces michiganensis]
MGVGHTPLPSGSSLHFGNLIHRKNIAAKTRRGVIVCAPRSTRDVQVVYDLLLAHRRSRAAAKNDSSNAAAGAAGDSKNEDYETLGHLTQAALTGCPLMIVGTTAPTFIHFSTVDAILDERESGSACNFVIVTVDKEHRFAADMSTDYTEWIYAMRDAMTIGNRRSFRGRNDDADDSNGDDNDDKNGDYENAPLDDPTPPRQFSSLFNIKRSKSFSKSPSAVNLARKFGLPVRSHTFDNHASAAAAATASFTAAAAASPPAVYDLPPDDSDDHHHHHYGSNASGSGSPPRQNIFVDGSYDNDGVIVPYAPTTTHSYDDDDDASPERVLPVPYVPRPASSAATATSSATGTVRRRSDANVRFADHPPAAPPKDTAVVPEATAEREDDNDEDDDDEDVQVPLARTTSNRPPRIGGMVGQVPPPQQLARGTILQQSSSDLPISTHPSINKSLSRKISTFFGVDSADTANGQKSPPLDGFSNTTVGAAAKGAKSIGRKFSNIFAAATATTTSTGDSDRRGRGRSSAKAAARAAEDNEDQPSSPSAAAAATTTREPRARSLVRMFSRSSVADNASADNDHDKNVTDGDDDKTRDSRSRRQTKSNSSTTRNSRSRSSSRTRLFTLVPSVRYTGSASLGNMFRKHTGDPEIDDDDVGTVLPLSLSAPPPPPPPPVAADEEDEELPRRSRPAVR